MTEDKRRELRYKLERRDLKILQLKQNMEVLHELSEQKLQAAKGKLQKELKDAKTTLKKFSDKLSDVEHTNEFLGEEVEEQAVKIGYQAHEIKTQAEKIKSLVQRIKGRDRKSARLMMRQAVKLLNKLAK
jgi:chromosome segregation ATPase